MIMDKDQITVLHQQLISLYTFSMALRVPDRNNMFPYHTLLHRQDRMDVQGAVNKFPD